MPRLTQGALAALIDHTLLKPEASSNDIKKLCAEALNFGFASVCIQPFRVRLAADLLRNSPIKVCTVVGFPLGANCSHVKAVETETAIAEGATEIDMVMNLGAFKEGDNETVENDIRAVVQAANGQTVKVILESASLSDTEIVRACNLVIQGGAHFVKTSSGFGVGGARVEHVRLMREAVGETFGVKASGGIRDKQTLINMVQAGANRIGTSSGVSLLSDGVVEGGY